MITRLTWMRCAAWLDAALAHAGRTHSLMDVAAMVDSGEARLWLGERCALVTLIEEDPLERRLLLWLAGGDLGELRETMLPQLEGAARAAGCRRLLIVGRAGWERALKPKGFAPLARIIAKEL